MSVPRIFEKDGKYIVKIVIKTWGNNIHVVKTFDTKEQAENYVQQRNSSKGGKDA
jgi:hypothetical protein